MKTFTLPKDHRPYIDKYFLRAKEILQKDELNPTVRVQVFIRDGNCKVYGINEATAIITKYAKGVKVWALKEGSPFAPGEIVMLLEAPIQEIIDLETMYLGVLSAETTVENDGTDVNLNDVERHMAQIVKLAGDRPVSYFGARHWRWDADRIIAKACFDAGAKSCSTDIGAEEVEKEGTGTIPHSLQAIYHWKYGLENAVFRSIAAFCEHTWTPKIALVDYANQEILDSIRIAQLANAIRIDTCGENYMQGVIPLTDVEYGKVGVSVAGVYLVRKLLNDSGYENVKIILSSGFGNPEKVKAFTDAEKEIDIKLFNALGVGGVYHSRMATADIIEVEGKEIHKVGRVPLPRGRLERII